MASRLGRAFSVSFRFRAGFSGRFFSHFTFWLSFQVAAARSRVSPVRSPAAGVSGWRSGDTDIQAIPFVYRLPYLSHVSVTVLGRLRSGFEEASVSGEAWQGFNLHLYTSTPGLPVPVPDTPGTVTDTPVQSQSQMIQIDRFCGF